MRFGTEIRDRGVKFRLWAPKQAQVILEIEGHEALKMRAEAGGWHSVDADAARAGSLYRFAISGGMTIPDPASRYQPGDVHGPS